MEISDEILCGSYATKDELEDETDGRMIGRLPH